MTRSSLEGRTAGPPLSRVCVCGGRLELVSHERLVADHPRVVPGLDQVRVPGAELHLRAVVVLDRQAPGPDDPDVAKLTAVRAGHGLHALGPHPARLEGHARGG